MKFILKHIGFLLLFSIQAYAADYPLTKNELTQWVKITSQLNEYNFSTIVEELESSTIDCGYHCKILKLSTTPFTASGTLKLSISNHCTGTTVKLPFNTENEYLITPLKTYKATIGSEYCGFHYVNVIVSGDPRANTGYQIDLDLIK